MVRRAGKSPPGGARCARPRRASSGTEQQHRAAESSDEGAVGFVLDHLWAAHRQCRAADAFDRRRVRATNVPRISRRRVMRACCSTWREVEGIGSTTLTVRCPQVVKDEPDGALVGRLRGSVLLLGPLPRAAAARTSHRRAATFRRGAPSPRIWNRSKRWARASDRDRATSWKRRTV